MSLRAPADAPLAVAPVAFAPARAQTGSRLALVLAVGEATGETEEQMRKRIMAAQQAENDRREQKRKDKDRYNELKKLGKNRTTDQETEYQALRKKGVGSMFYV